MQVARRCRRHHFDTVIISIENCSVLLEVGTKRWGSVEVCSLWHTPAQWCSQRPNPLVRPALRSSSGSPIIERRAWSWGGAAHFRTRNDCVQGVTEVSRHLRGAASDSRRDHVPHHVLRQASSHVGRRARRPLVPGARPGVPAGGTAPPLRARGGNPATNAHRPAQGCSAPGSPRGHEARPCAPSHLGRMTRRRPAEPVRSIPLPNGSTR